MTHEEWEKWSLMVTVAAAAIQDALCETNSQRVRRRLVQARADLESQLAASKPASREVREEPDDQGEAPAFVQLAAAPAGVDSMQLYGLDRNGRVWQWDDGWDTGRAHGWELLTNELSRPVKKDGSDKP